MSFLMVTILRQLGWLQCAEITGDTTLIANYKKHAIQIAEVTKEGIDTDGGLWYEYNPETQKLMAEKHSWPQAELMISCTMLEAFQEIKPI